MSQPAGLPMTGGCQCGGVRYQLWDAPEAVHICHCGQCRRSSGSAFAVWFIMRGEAFRLVAGTPRTWSRDGGSGGRTAYWFCPDCGTRLWRVRDRAPAFRSVGGGTLDAPPDLTGAVHLFTDSKLPGVVIPDGALSFPGDPGA